MRRERAEGQKTAQSAAAPGREQKRARHQIAKINQQQLLLPPLITAEDHWLARAALCM